MGDNINVQIEKDGTVTVTTDKVSDQNHMAADEFLNYLEDLMGGSRQTEKRKEKHIHVHSHAKVKTKS